MKSLVLTLSIALTTCAPVPVAAETEKEQEPYFLSLDANQGARCMDPEGCIIITKAAMRALIEEIKEAATQVCRKTI